MFTSFSTPNLHGISLILSVTASSAARASLLIAGRSIFVELMLSELTINVGSPPKLIWPRALENARKEIRIKIVRFFILI